MCTFVYMVHTCEGLQPECSREMVVFLRTLPRRFLWRFLHMCVHIRYMYMYMGGVVLCCVLLRTADTQTTSSQRGGTWRSVCRTKRHVCVCVCVNVMRDYVSNTPLSILPRYPGDTSPDRLAPEFGEEGEGCGGRGG